MVVTNKLTLYLLYFTTLYGFYKSAILKLINTLYPPSLCVDILVVLYYNDVYEINTNNA